VCPPDTASKLAEDVAHFGFDGIYADVNAISPARVRTIAKTIESAGAKFVDGAIIGIPPWEPGTTRLYLCGSAAQEVAENFTRNSLDAIVMQGAVGSASTLKWSMRHTLKGTTALVSAILAVAEREGVRDTLAQEWSLSQPELAKSAADRIRANTSKAWRFVGEMEEIAATFADASLPREFHAAASEVYRRLACFKEAMTHYRHSMM